MGWITVTERYEPVQYRASKAGRCVHCGKRATRSVTFEQTLNPFNKAEDGSLKTYRQIMVELREEAIVWKKEPVAHQGCEFEHRRALREAREGRETSQ